jgi:hypothetical protein
MTESPPSPRRRLRRPLTIAVATLGGLALVLTLASMFVGQRMDQRVADEVGCRLPLGAEVAEVDIDARPLVALATHEVGAVRLTIEADAATVQAMLADRPANSDLPAGLAGADVAIVDGSFRVSFDGAGVPASLVLEPSLLDGTIRLTPESVLVGNRSFAPELLAGALPGGGEALAPHDLPGPDLPDGAELVSVGIDEDRLEIGVEIAGAEASAYLQNGGLGTRCVTAAAS